MKPNGPIASPWRDTTSQSTAQQATVGQWFAELRDFGEPADFAVSRLQARLRISQKASKRSLWFPRLGFSLAALLLASTAGAVVWQHLRRVPTAAISSPIDSTPAQRSLTVVNQVPTEAPMEQAVVPKARRRVVAPTSDSLTRETELLSRAIARLRQGNDPAGALQILNVYGTTFPRGLLAAEATTARVDALLALGRKPQALALLRKLNLATWPRGGELRLLRAELSADSGDCRFALADFAAVLATAKVASVRARAERGQAKCMAASH